MLTSPPPIIPRDAHTLYTPATLPPPSFELPNNQSSTPQNQTRRQHVRNPLLASLEAEEAALYARKSNVRRFGATWLRPPGVSKTYQAMVDEAAERAEQEAIARREAALAEQQQAAEEEERRLRIGVDGEDGEAGMERDLDDEVPDADADGAQSVGSEDGLGVDGEDEDEEAERDLDDDVPEAGSYEHTDTEVEDESDDDVGSPAQMAEEVVSSVSGGGAGPTVVQNPRPPMPPVAMWNLPPREGVEEGSSEMYSSPSLPRQARRQTVRGRGGGRENERGL